MSLRELVATYLKAFQNNEPIEPPNGVWKAASLMPLAGVAQAVSALQAMEQQEGGLRKMSTEDVEAYFEKLGKNMEGIATGARDMATQIALGEQS